MDIDLKQMYTPEGRKVLRDQLSKRQVELQNELKAVQALLSAAWAMEPNYSDR